MVIIAILFFLLPIALATGGAMWLHATAGGQLAGGLGGLLVGAALARWIGRWIR